MGWPFTIVYTLLIIGAIYFTMVTVPNQLNRQDWPKVLGTVTDSEVIKRQRRNKTGDAIAVYSAKVHYQYHVAGSDYQANQVMWADHHTDENIKQQLARHYPAGANATVYYNPNNPATSALEPNLSDKLIAVGAFLFTSIGIMAFALYRTARKRK